MTNGAMKFDDPKGDPLPQFSDGKQGERMRRNP